MQLDWSHVFLKVKNLEEMLSFYEDTLGFEVKDRGDNMAFISQIDDEHHQLAFLEGRDEQTQRGHVGHFAFRVKSLKDVRDLRAKLLEHPSVDLVAPITHGNTWSIYFADPEGNGIEVFCDTPWDAVQPMGEPWDPDLSDDELHEFTLELLKQKGEVVPNRRLN